MQKRSATPAVSPDGFLPGSTLNRLAGNDSRASVAISSYDAQAHTVEAVLSAGTRVRRWGIFEELAIDAAAIDLSRVGAGQVRLLDSHSQDSVDRIFGVLLSARIENGLLVGVLQFSDTEKAREIEARVAAGDIAGISVGYRVTKWTLSQVENETEVWRADQWELLEVSLVAVPADPAAMIRSAGETATLTTQTETDDMRRNAPSGDAPAPIPVTAPVTEATRNAAPAQAPAPDAAAIIAAERSRVADIHAIGRQAGMEQAVIDAAVRNASTVDAFRAAAFDHLAARQIPASHVRVERDETETRMQAMGEALAIRLMPAAGRPEPGEAARAFMDYSLVDLAAERLNERRVPGAFGRREDILQRAFHATTDFPIIFENALNRALAARYAQATPTYRRIAAQRTYTDFRDHTTVRLGDFPDLQPVNPEGGEIKSGTFSESKEKTAVKAYGVGVSFSRQMLVNDSLGAINDILNQRGLAVARFEDRTFYAMLLSNPILQETSRAVFNTTDKSQASAGTAIDIAALSAGRAALRKRLTLDKSEMELTASILLVGPDKETEAQQLVAPVNAVVSGAVNPFSGKLDVIVSGKLTGNQWYLFASVDEAPCFEWGLLDGYTAPRFRIDNPFGVQGTACTLEHDFGCGAIDWRGGWKNPGN